MSDFTTTLFARPSLIEGAARIMDFSGSLNIYNQSNTPYDADAESLRSDGLAVLEDARNALAKLREEVHSI